MIRFKFGKIGLSGFPLPARGKRLTIYDTEVQRLALRMTHLGARTFYVVKRSGTSVSWLKIGSFPEVTVEQARAAAQKILGEFAQGQNPAAVKRALKAEPTVTEFFEEYGRRHGEKKLSWKEDKQRFRDYLQPTLGSRKLSEIKRDKVSLILSAAENAGKAPATVRQIRALASIIFNKAIEWGYLETNPVTGLKVNGAVVQRDRFLDADELPRFFAALEEEPSLVMRHFILMALLTGARRENVQAMHWREIDLKSATWRIKRTKNGQPQNVILTPTAIDILMLRKDVTNDGFVFPSLSESGHITDPKKALTRVLERAGIPYGRKVENGVTLHDLRRTLGSWQAATGASLTIIGKSLNHKSISATQIYARLGDDPVRRSVNTATDAMLEAAGLKDKAEVVLIRRERS
jgi:integrase